MKKILVLFVLVPFILSSCGAPTEETQKTVEKKPFYIETYSVWKRVETYSTEKPGRLVAASSLVLWAESAGEVTSLLVKEGQKIKKGMKLIGLRDTVNSYDIRLAQAENALKIQDASIASTKLSLDKAVSDTEIAYEQAKKAYDLLMAKNTLVYETLLNTNIKTLESYNENYKSYLWWVETLMNNFLYEGDKIMGMTSAFQYTVDGWKPYLGAKVGNLYSQATNEWNNTYASRWDVRMKKEKWGTLADATLQSDLDVITTAYTRLQKYIDTMVEMTQNNVVWGGLSQEMQNGWVALWNGIKTQVNASESAFNAWKAQTLSFFKNYKNGEIATKLAIESLTRELSSGELATISGSDMRLTYENTRLDMKDKIRSAELALKQAKTARDSASKNRDITLNQLAANRTSTSLSLEQAERDYSKLALFAPFDGSVTKVMASIGQRTNMGTPLIEIASNNPEILIDLDEETASAIKNGDEVRAQIGKNSYTGKVLAVSRTAGANLLYTTRISVPSALSDLWSAVTVIFTLEKESIDPDAGKNIILPLKSVKIVSEQEGEIVILSTWGVLEYHSVQLGRVLSEWVEILDTIPPASEVVLSDLSNYVSDKYTLIKKN